MFLAGIFRAGGTLRTAADVQAVPGAFTTVLTLTFARAWLGRRALCPLAACAVGYVFYGMPLEPEWLVRHETLLVLLATMAFGAWFYALRRGGSRGPCNCSKRFSHISADRGGAGGLEPARATAPCGGTGRRLRGAVLTAAGRVQALQPSERHRTPGGTGGRPDVLRAHGPMELPGAGRHST